VLTNVSSTSQRYWLSDLIGLAAILCLFYFFYLGSYPLFVPDEGRYSEVAREMIATGDYITPRVNGVAFLDKPVLYYWLQAAAIKLFGLNEWALRFFPAMIGIFGCLITYTTSRYLFNRRTGLFSAMILATSPLYFGCAHYANLDLEVAVWVSSALLCLLCGIRDKSKPRPYFIFAAYFFAALAFLTKGLLGIAFPVMITGAWTFLLWRWDILKSARILPGLLLMAAMILPWYTLVQKANPAFLHYFFVTQQVTRFLSAAEFNNPAPLWFYLPIVLVGFFPWACLLPQTLMMHVKHIWRARYHYSAELYLLLWVVIVFVFFSTPKSKVISYILPVFPPLAILTGRYLSLAWEERRSRATRGSMIAFASMTSLLAALMFAAPHYQWLDLTINVKPYFTAIASVFLACALACLILTKSIRQLFTISLSCSVAFLMLLAMSAAHLNTNTSKPLATHLATIIKPEDEVVNYFKYYQDIPLYLQKRVTVVADWDSPDIAKNDNWRREFWYGMPFQKTDEWLISENNFWKKWIGEKRLFVFINSNYLAQFEKHAKHYVLVGRYNDILLISNRA
jgi:4-amino-4-deoxy-L-arabinose transferase-like glycosyltransferase